MAIDLSKMPKLGFGLMRLPEKDDEMEIIDEVTKNRSFERGNSYT